MEEDMFEEEIEKYLPHRHPFLFVTRIEKLDDKNGGICHLHVRKGVYPILEDGSFPSILVIEALAQSVAALNGSRMAMEKKRGREEGYLVRLSNFVFQGSVKEGDRVILKVTFRRKLGNLVLFHGEARVGERLICSGELTFFRESRDIIS